MVQGVAGVVLMGDNTRQVVATWEILEDLSDEGFSVFLKQLQVLRPDLFLNSDNKVS